VVERWRPHLPSPSLIYIKVGNVRGMGKGRKRAAAATSQGTSEDAEGAVEATRQPAADPKRAKLSSHSTFFDQLVDLVPAKYYHDGAYEQVNPRFLKKAEREAAKLAAKEAYKRNKKEKLDPDQSKTSLEVQRQQNEKQKPAGGEEGSSAHAGLQFNIGAGSGASREELKAKLQAKLELLRSQRKVEEREKSTANAKQWLQQQSQERKAAKQLNTKISKAKSSHGHKAGAGKVDDSNIEFGKVQLPDSNATLAAKKRQKPLSKQELLDRVTAMKQKAEAMANSKEGQAEAKKEAWSSALARARGEHILDDPKLLRRSMKRENRAKQKSREAWQERQKKETDRKEATQRKRKENLKKRSDSKIQKKKDKRDKKLLRAGFEGRKVGTIQKKGGGGGGKK